MKRILIILLLLIGILAGGGYFLFLETLKPGAFPEKVLNAEEAIATSSTIALASMNISHIRHIDNMFKGVKDPSPISLPKQVNVKSEKSLLDKLKKQGVNLYETTNYALAAIDVGNNKPSYTFVLYGNYKKEKIKQAIQQSHLVDTSNEKYWLITANEEQHNKKDPCAAPAKATSVKQYALQIQDTRIIMSSPKLMPSILTRFMGKARAGIELSEWRLFRKDKVIAATIMAPKKANKGAVDLPSGVLLGAVSKQPLTALYGGAVISLLPSPGLTVSIDAHAADASWPIEVKTNYDNWLSEILSDLKGMPTLTSLFDALTVQVQGNILQLKAVVSRSLLDNLEKLTSEFIKMLLTNISFDDDKGVTAGEEKIVNEEELKKYSSIFDFSSVGTFEDKSLFTKSNQVVGPFGIRLKKIGLLDTDSSVVELTINAEGKGFENIFDMPFVKEGELPGAGLIITSVNDKEGNNLLREELCGKTRNALATPLTVSRDKEYVDGNWILKSLKVSGVKSVRLKQLTLLSQVANIRGKVIVRAATQTSIKSLTRPFKKKVIETSKVRMYFKKSNASTVKYDLSGDLSRIMDVRAKNANGQYLASNGSSASNYDGIKTVSKYFRGKVASIEIVVADQVASEEYPFYIDKMKPRYGVKGGEHVGMMTTSKKRFLREYSKVKYTKECKDKKKMQVGAFLVCLNKFGQQSETQVGGEFDVIGPAEQAFQNDLSVGVLSLDSVRLEGGEKIPFNKSTTADFNYKFDTHYNEKKKEWQITNRRLQASSVRVLTDNEKLKDKKVTTINGSLTIRIPKVPKYIELDADELGVIRKNKDGITATISAFEDWSTFIDLQGPANKVMRFMALSNNGTVLNTGNDRLHVKKYTTWGRSNEEKEKINALPKKWQGMITIYGKPEKIRIFYANDFDIIKKKFQFSVNHE